MCLNFIGQANKRYNSEEKFRALLANTKHSVDYELKHEFVSAPKACNVQLEKKAQEYILLLFSTKKRLKEAE